jgi:hypothetical protein
LGAFHDALAVEMEGRGFLEAVNINALVMGGVVRGISDLLSGKAEADARGSQALAADAASAAVFEILHALPPPAQSRERKPVKKPPPKPSKPRSPGPRPKPASALDVVSGATVAAPAFLETPSTFSKAVYFSKGEVLAKITLDPLSGLSSLKSEIRLKKIHNQTATPTVLKLFMWRLRQPAQRRVPRPIVGYARR